MTAEASTRSSPTVGQLSKAPHQIGAVYTGARVEFELIEPQGYEMYFEHERDILTVGFGEGEIASAVNTDRISQLRCLPFGFHYFPAGTAVYAANPGPKRPILTIRVDPSLTDEIVRNMYDEPPSPRPLANVLSPHGRYLTRAMVEHLAAGQRGGLLAAEALATTALVETFQGSDGPARSKAGRAARPGPAARVERVKDYVEANLSTNITLAEMADIAALSVFHFSREFKRATGMSPHAFVQIRRIERAKSLLVTDGSESLLQVALACGFSSQSHFSTVFKRFSGVSPGRYRQDAAS